LEFIFDLPNYYNMAPKKSSKGKVRNYELVAGTGLMRFSRARMFAKHAIHIKSKAPRKKVPAKGKKELYITKKVEGAKNGGQRKILINKPAALLEPSRTKRIKEKTRRSVNSHIRRLRPSLTPGTVLIILVGPHKGKRVVFLKQLSSGLLMVTGPYKYNGYPLRRINQNYVIGTSTKIDLSGIQIPENLTDDYFRRCKKHNKKSTDADIFSSKKQEYEVSEQRKTDQKIVDDLLCSAIKKRDDKAFLKQYLKNVFFLRKNEFPHNMIF